MNKWALGSKTEKEVCEILERQGWITRRWAKVRFGPQDVVGCDIIVKKSGRTLWIQVKGSVEGMPAVRKTDIEKFKDLWRHLGDKETIMWIGYDKLADKWKFLIIEDPFTNKLKVSKI